MAERLCAEDLYAIRRDMVEVYREMGGGFLEAVIQECLDLHCWSTPAATPSGGRTNDSINLDRFCAFPRVPWLKNWFRKDMQTASDNVV